MERISNPTCCYCRAMFTFSGNWKAHQESTFLDGWGAVKPVSELLNWVVDISSPCVDVLFDVCMYTRPWWMGGLSKPWGCAGCKSGKSFDRIFYFVGGGTPEIWDRSHRGCQQWGARRLFLGYSTLLNYGFWGPNGSTVRILDGQWGLNQRGQACNSRTSCTDSRAAQILRSQL